MASLETVFDFVTALEARETAACGLRPDPDAAAEARHRSIAKTWLRCFPERAPLRGPSSRWMNDEKIKEWGWCGESRNWDMQAMVQMERRASIPPRKYMNGVMLSCHPGGPFYGFKTRHTE